MARVDPRTISPVARLTPRWLLNRQTLLSSPSRRSNGLHFLINPAAARLSLSLSPPSYPSPSNIKEESAAGSNLSSSARGEALSRKERINEGWTEGEKDGENVRSNSLGVI